MHLKINNAKPYHFISLDIILFKILFLEFPKFLLLGFRSFHYRYSRETDWVMRSWVLIRKETEEENVRVTACRKGRKESQSGGGKER